MRFVLAAITMACLAVSAGAADRLSAFVGSQDLDRLREGDVLKTGIVRGRRLQFLPSVSSAAGIADSVTAMKPSVGAELLQIIPGGGSELDSPAGMLALYNALHAVSTMKGITYYSVTRGKEMPLFLQSYVIPSPDRTASPLPDPVFSEIPPAHDLFTLQEDTSFGRNTYAEHVAALPDHLYMETENLTTISYLLLPIVTPHNLVSHVLVVPAGKDVLFYGVSCLKSGLPLGDLNSRTQSMQNRLSALAGWLGKRLQATTTAAAFTSGG
jgi:hypothetical protein